MWLTSKMPTPVRTAMCSLMMPQPIAAGYSTGISQPLKSTIFAPIWRWTAFSAVFRTVVAVPAGVASTEDKIQTSTSEQWLVCQDGVTVYRITRFFRRSNGRDQPLSAELHPNVRASGHVRPCQRRLLPSHAAAHGFEFKPGILRSFHGSAHSLARE
jgi:hypothetical protein